MYQNQQVNFSPKDMEYSNSILCLSHLVSLNLLLHANPRSVSLTMYYHHQFIYFILHSPLTLVSCSLEFHGYGCVLFCPRRIVELLVQCLAIIRRNYKLPSLLHCANLKRNLRT